MKTFQEFHNDRLLNEAAPLALPAAGWLAGSTTVKVALDLAAAFTAGIALKLGIDNFTSDNISNVSDAITTAPVEFHSTINSVLGYDAIDPADFALTTATPEQIVDAVAPHVTSAGQVAATTESAAGIGSALDVPANLVSSILTYAAGIGLSTLDVCLILGAGTVIATAGGIMFFKNGGPNKLKNLLNKLKNLLKKALKKVIKLLKIAGRAAIYAFMFLGKALLDALMAAFGFLVGLLGAGLMAIITMVIGKLRKKDKEKDEEKDEESNILDGSSSK